MAVLSACTAIIAQKFTPNNLGRAMLRIIINGILGQMGQAVTRCAVPLEDYYLVGGVDTLETFESEEIFVSINPEDVIVESDVAIDFSSPAGTSSIAKACQKHNTPLVTGTTGISAKQQADIQKLSETVAVVQAANFSIGLTLMNHYASKISQLMEGDIDVEIIDTHHRNMPVTPSGTAMHLAGSMARALNVSPDDIRVGRTSAHQKKGSEIAVHSLRGGSVVGDHQVHLLCGCENIVLNHQALSLKIFADGALRAAKWLNGKSPGLYSMENVLGLK